MNAMKSVFKALLLGTLVAGVTSACTADHWNGEPWGWTGSRGGPMDGPMGGPMHGPMSGPMHGGMMNGMMGAIPMPSTGGRETWLEANSPEAKRFNHYCSQCHALPSPAQHTRAEWPAVVARMKAHMQELSQQSQVPDPPELEKIIAYLQKNAYSPVNARE
ncbi:MAG TPA: hypothetical protein VES89_00815 [Candidatus Competibacteraceae bacterium]|nr:hypothetical protein [Candidatus Competibacteraceae bacterium]